MDTDAGEGAGADPRVVRALERVPGVVGTSVAALGALVFAGWALGYQQLTGFSPSLATMKANTSFAFIALGLALRWSRSPAHRARRAKQALSVLAAILGALTLTEHLLQADFGIDQLLVRDRWSAAGPGRMSPVTAMLFVLLGGALFVSERGLRRTVRPTEWLALASSLASLLALLGYAYGVPSLYEVQPYNAIALHTALGFAALSAGVLCTQPRAGLMAIVSARGPGGALARRLLPAMILIPIALGAVREAGQRLGLYGTGFGIAVHVVSNVVCLGLLVLAHARAVEQGHRREENARVKLLESEEDLAITIQSIGDAVIATDRAGRITRMNPTAERLTGWSFEAARGRPLGEVFRIVDEETRRPIESPVDRILREGAVVGLANHTMLVSKDGTERAIANSGAPIRDVAGALRGVVLVFHDQTAERNAERALRESELDLRRALAAARDETRERARTELALRQTEEQLRQSQKLEAIGTLAGGVAHDFNNILSIVLGFSELLLDELEPTHPMRGDLEQIANAGRRASDLTRQLLAFSRRQVLQPKLVNLNDIISGMTKMLDRVIGEDIELVFLPHAALAPTLVDPGQMEQVLLNVVLNARDAMPRGGKLTLETANVELDAAYSAERVDAEPGAYVVVSVSDTGTGMDLATQARIFEPFFTTKEQGKGTGLGLSTVHGIVRQSGGHMGVSSAPGSGSTFKIYLPRAPALPEAASQAAGPARTLSGAETILLVEDDEQVRTLASAVLTRSGYAVLAAASGAQALETCRAHRGRIHLLLTDVVMPQMSGRELWEHVARLVPDIQVLFMSGYTDDTIVRHGLLVAEFDFVQKPLGPTLLLTKVRAALDGTWRAQR